MPTDHHKSGEKERRVRLIAFYLPQFHPIPENDIWWGKGFTEWTNVAKAKPMFRGHHQPRLPADLGFYDLRVPETRAAQAELAQEHGIEGFCYWHYWFNGKRLLERPFNEVLKSGEPKLPFCLGWANESWTGVWHGCPNKMLMEQTYPGRGDEEAHFYAFLEAFFDKRYITIDEKPVFHVYKPHNLPEPKRFTDYWRELAIKEGLKGLYFIGEDWTFQWNPEKDGFDASVPHTPGLAFYKLVKNHSIARAMARRVYKRLQHLSPDLFYRPNVFSYEDFIKCALHKLKDDFDQYPNILPSWDNTPRSGVRGYVLVNSTPELFRNHLKEAIQQVIHREPDKRVIFIKSWNEWAEGNYLEPDQKFGRAYLKVCKDEVMLK